MPVAMALRITIAIVKEKYLPNPDLVTRKRAYPDEIFFNDIILRKYIIECYTIYIKRK